MWFRNSKSGQETQIGWLRGFPSFEPLHTTGNKDQAFLFEAPLRLTFFSCHLDSTNGSTVEAFDFNKRKLIQLSPNYATPVPLPGEPAFLTLTENRYVPIPGSTKTANCSYIEHWDAQLQKIRYARGKAPAIFYGASVYRPERTPAVITIRQNAD